MSIDMTKVEGGELMAKFIREKASNLVNVID